MVQCNSQPLNSMLISVPISFPGTDPLRRGLIVPFRVIKGCNTHSQGRGKQHLQIVGLTMPFSRMGHSTWDTCYYGAMMLIYYMQVLHVWHVTHVVLQCMRHLLKPSTEGLRCCTVQSSLAFWGIRKTTGVVSTRDSLARLEAWITLQSVIQPPPQPSYHF